MIFKAKYIKGNDWQKEDGNIIFLSCFGYLNPKQNKWYFIELEPNTEFIVKQICEIE